MKIFKHLWLILLVSIFFVPSQNLTAQGMMDPVHFQITKVPQKIKAGESFNVVIQANMDGNWHLYSINNDPDAGPYPTKLTSLNDNLEVAGKIKESKPIVKYDPNFDAQLGFHEHQGTFTVPLKFQPSVTGKNTIKVQVFYQTCNDKFCLPPKKKTVSATIDVGETEPPSQKKSQTAQAAEPDNTGLKQQTDQPETGQKKSIAGARNITKSDGSPSEKKAAKSETSVDKITSPAKAGVASKGLFSFLWIALTAGFAALLTPCVFPMIPLTVSFFSKKNDIKGRQGIGAAVVFGLAIVATFTILGALLALLIGAAGANQFAANPWVNLFIGLILLAFAISLLGAFEIRLPYQLTNWLNRKSNDSGGVLGILFMSLTISAVSFSCTAPFVGGVLAATAGGEWFYPIIGMIAFSAAFASPFVLFAMFPGWLESLPKSGSWMNIVKVLLGFVELAAAVKFFSNVDLVWGLGLISRPFAIAIWIAIFLLAGLYMLGVFSMEHETKPAQIGTGRLMLSIPFLLFSFYLIPGLLGASLGIWDAWLPPKQATDVSVVYSIVQNGGGQNATQKNEFDVWSPDYQASVQTAKKQGKPIFIDFTGYTCTNCRAMEANVFPLRAVQEQFEQMELVRLYTDDATEGPKRQKFQFRLTGTIALPTYAMVDPNNGNVLSQISGYTDKESFEQFLEKGMGAFHQNKSQYLGQL